MSTDDLLFNVRPMDCWEFTALVSCDLQDHQTMHTFTNTNIHRYTYTQTHMRAIERAREGEDKETNNQSEKTIHESNS